ncbi:MAG TPA: hypothetical protein VI653_24460, partial [Steroidobacteraceae bacterium]
MTHRPSDTDISRLRFAVLAPWALTLCACNGANTGGPVSTVNQAAGPGNVLTLALTLPVSNATTNSASDAAPLFHTASIDLEEPGEVDSQNPSATAHLAPHLQPVPARLALLSTRRLTRHTIDAMLRDGRAPTESIASSEDATPLATGTVIATYTPAQIRAAYGLPILPSSNVSLSQAQMAQFGAGQTIYIVDAQHDPNVTAELSTFNQRFGLPSCTKVAIDPGASLPVAAASSSGCTVSVVYSTSAGKMTTAVPTYDSGWATEIALDVQWAHATAPLARIVLIEATDASFNSLQGAISLANAMGPGVVSMSFGSQEGNWTTSVDSLFTTPQMTYLAATGDSGTGVEWPSVSTHVLAVGGS